MLPKYRYKFFFFGYLFCFFKKKIMFFGENRDEKIVMVKFFLFDA